jgi:uncharacterized membrane protein YecN with MAPEG domain
MVTLLYAGCLGLLGVLLANQVLYVRLRAGSEPPWRAGATERVQGNFVENVPLALILLFLLESAGTGSAALHAFGASLLVLRLLHAWGMSRHPGANYPRLIGAQGTFLLMSVMGVCAIYLFGRELVVA